MANSERGELSLKLEGREYVLRPSYEAIQAFEKQTGKGLLQLGLAAHRGELTTTEAGVIATECIRAWGRETEDIGSMHANPDKISRMLVAAEGGITEAMLVIGAMLALAATGGCTETGEAKPPAITSKPQTKGKSAGG